MAAAATRRSAHTRGSEAGKEARGRRPRRSVTVEGFSGGPNLRATLLNPEERGEPAMSGSLFEAGPNAGGVLRRSADWRQPVHPWRPAAHGGPAEVGQLPERGDLDTPSVEVTTDQAVTLGAAEHVGQYLAADAVACLVEDVVAPGVIAMSRPPEVVR